MSKISKLIFSILIGVAIVSITLTVFSFLEKEKEYKKRLLVEDKLAVTLKDKKMLEKAKDDAYQKIAKMDEEIKNFMAEVEEQKTKIDLVSAELDAKEEEIENMKDELKTEKKEKMALSEKLKGVEIDYRKVEKNIVKLEEEKNKLEKELADLKAKSVELEPIVVGPLSGGVAGTKDIKKESVVQRRREPLKGAILVVNKEYNFVITDLGQDDGVDAGMVFEIRDGDKLLDTAQIDKVYDTMSSATLWTGKNINNIKKGNLLIETR